MRHDLLPRLTDRLRATPAELVGLATLLAGVVAVAGLLWWTTASGTATSAHPAAATGGPSILAPSAPASVLTVHVSGEVVSPGIAHLPSGARVADAVEAAGGLTLGADPGGLNLARLLVDGEQVVVPAVGRTAGSGAGTGDAAADAALRADGRLDLNRATASELEELPGVGPVLAERIVAHRAAHGPFREVGQLRDVSGIGERTFQALADLVTVG